MNGPLFGTDTPAAAWRPTPEYLDRSRLRRFMAEVGCAGLEELQARAVADPAWFWREAVADIGVRFDPAPTTVLDTSLGIAWARWFEGAGFNYVRMAVDEPAASHPAEMALSWEGEDGEVRHFTRLQLRWAVDRAARAMAALGVGRGDRVGIFLPMIPEAAIAVLAVGKLGAIYTPIFSGYGADAVAGRLADCGAKLLITADGFARRGIGIVGGVLVGLWIALLSLSNTNLLRQKLIEALNEKLDADVELGNFDVKAFPVLRIHGDRLKLRLKGQTNPAPFIEIRHFEVTGGLFGLLHRQRRFTSVELDGLRITIPPRTEHDREAGARAASSTADGPVLIDLVTSKDAQLIIVPKDPPKEPRIFAIHDLALESVGFNRKMPFTATLTNPLPKGEIATTGHVRPVGERATRASRRWTASTASSTRTSTRSRASAASSIPSASSPGHLEEIDVHGTTTTPDFSIDVGGTPVPLTTTFHAVVDGTNGNTYLKQVDAKLAETAISAAGAIESKPGVKGRTVRLDLKIVDGRIQDILKLAVKAKNPVMVGRIALQALLLLPPGHDKVIDRLELTGRFAIENAQFTDKAVQEKLAELSRRAQGKKPDEPIGQDRVGHARPLRAEERHDPLRAPRVRPARGRHRGHRRLRTQEPGAGLHGDPGDGRHHLEGGRRRHQGLLPEGGRSDLQEARQGGGHPDRHHGSARAAEVRRAVEKSVQIKR